MCIRDRYQSVTVLLESGKVITGMVMEESDSQLQLVLDPLANAAPTLVEKDAIEERSKAKLSLMPQGLLDRLTREEILDLVAYVLAGGDPQNKLFMEHKHH